mgnify:CR=1 FL=1
MNPIYRSEDAVEVWASLRVEANYSSDLTQTTGDTFGYGSLHHLTLNRTAQGWQVVGDDCEESDLCGYLSGCGTASLPSEDILAAIQNYLDLRAAVMAGRIPAAPDRCTAPLREDAQLWRRPPWTNTPSFTMYSAAPPTLPPYSRAARRCR